MNVSRYFLRHWFFVLIRENILGLCLVLASAASLLVQGIAASSFNWWYLVPIAFLGAYLWVHLFSVTRLARQTYETVPLPYSICLAQSQDWHRGAIRQQEQTLEGAKIAWTAIQRTHLIHQSDWTYFDEHRLDLTSSCWRDRIADIIRHFDRLTNRVPIRPVYHFFFAAPAPITFALGALIGRRMPMQVYQHAGIVKDPYAVVFSSENLDQTEGYHLLNKRVKEYKLIKFGPDTNDDIPSKPTKPNDDIPALIILDFTGHELPCPYPQAAGKELVYAHLKGTRGHIPLSENWIDIAQEITSLIFSYVDKDRSVHLLPGIPASLAFIVGTIVGTIPGVTLYHYNRHDGKYTEGIVLHEL